MIEKLENRRLFSYAAIEVGSTLTIDCNDDNLGFVDYLKIRVSAWKQVYINGQSWLNKTMVVVRTHKGNDIIESSTAWESDTVVEINGGHDDDTIITSGRKHRVKGEFGNDQIEVWGNQMGYVKAGMGDDDIYIGDRSAGLKVWEEGGHGTINATGVTSIANDAGNGDDLPLYLDSGGEDYDIQYESGGGNIRGSRFADYIHGSLGYDVIYGEGGDDIITTIYSDYSMNPVRNDEYDQIFGGGGIDWVWADPYDNVNPDCENVYQ